MPKRKINQTLALSGLAEDFKRYRLDNFKTDLAHHKNMYDKAMKFLENPKCIYFGGQSGSGKSHLSTALVKILVERGYTDFEYLKFAEDFPMIQYSLRNFDDEISKPARDKLNRFGTCKLLYIDDFLKVGNLDNVFEMIDSRYKRNLITIISSETYLESIKDEAIYGRIYEMCQGNVVTIEKHENKNYRLKG
jgi:DNA replication protein DnaC